MLKNGQENYCLQSTRISPKLEQKRISIQSPKLPNLTSTQKLSQKYFISPLSVEPLPKISTKKNLLMDVPSPKENKRSSIKFLREKPVTPLKKSITEEPFQDDSPFAIHETPIYSTETENLKLETSKSTDSLNYPKSVLPSSEKPNKTESLQDRLTPAISAEGPKENLENLSETIKKLKSELSTANETIKTKENIEKIIEQSHKEKVNSLSSENSNLKTYTQELSKKIEKIKHSKQKVVQEIDFIKKTAQNNLSKTEETIDVLKEEVKQKNAEIEQLRDVISRNELQKIKLQDSLKDAEKGITEIAYEYKVTDFHHEALKEKFKELSEEFKKSETKASLYEDTLSKLDLQKTIVKSLELKQVENSEEIKKLNFKIESLKYLVEVQRQQFHKKEAGYQATIQELLDKMENERVNAEVRLNENVKLKRALTVRDFFDEDLTSFSREEVQRYLSRMRLAEEESANRLVEIERLAKTIEYYKELILSKNEMIEVMEKEREDIQEEKEQKTIFQLIKEFKDIVVCNKCKKQTSTNFIRPCYHIFCSVCVPDNEICTVCYKKYNYISPNSYFEALFSLINHLDKLVN